MSGKKSPFNVNIFVHIKLLKQLTSVLLLMLAFSSSALETTIQAHKVDQSGAYGVSFGMGDNFFNQREFNWLVSYNRLEDINITWNDEDINVNLDTVDLALSYRYYPKSYNSFVKSLMVEFQAGVGVAITENKFVWPELNEEKYFSERGDINAMLSLSIHKKFTKQLAMHIGVKHYPDYSEFGDISAIFLGFSYTFGRQVGY